jgi:ABC-type taurine transport system substrate-binding protein
VGQILRGHAGRRHGAAGLADPQAEELAGQDVAVGYHSGSHFTTLQALEPFLDREQIKLKFVGSSWARVDAGVEGDVPATSVWGITYQVLEQLGFRKIVTTFDRLHVSAWRRSGRRRQIHGSP